MTAPGLTVQIKFLVKFLRKGPTYSIKSHLLSIALALLSVTATAQDCSKQCSAYADVEAAVSRLLSYPAYAGFDEKVLNGSGDLAAILIMKRLSPKDMDSRKKARQILLILDMAFEAPQLIIGDDNRRPTAAMLLLEHLQHTDYGRQSPTEIENTRFEIQHNWSTGKPMEFVSLGGSPPIDWEHTQWVLSVLRWTLDVKPGMTRDDLLKVFTTEGGISTRTQRTYVLKGCGAIHVDVTFSPASNEQDHLTEMPGDRIVTISKPYLDSFHAD
jgi:hypothetical protein